MKGSDDDFQVLRQIPMLCDLYALSVIEDDKAWFIEHRFLSTERAKAVARRINERCRTLRPHALELVEGFGVRAVTGGRDARPALAGSLPAASVGH